MAFDINNLSVSGAAYQQGLMDLNNFDSAPTYATDNKGMLDIFGSMYKAFSAYSTLNEGAKLAEAGGKYKAGVYRAAGEQAILGGQYEAKVYRQSGLAAEIATNFNIALDQQKTNRQQDALTRQFGDTISSNYATAGAQGISLSSGSFQAVQADVTSTAERTFTYNRNDAINRQSLMRFQGALTKMEYENKARAAVYSSQVAKQNYENQARAAIYEGKVEAYKAKRQAADTIGDSVFNIFGKLAGI